MTTYTPFPMTTLPSGVVMLESNPLNTVTMRQARLALYQTPSPTNTGKTLLDDVNAAVTTATDQSIPIWWEYAPTVRIDDPLVYELGTGLGLTQAQVEALFTAAAAL